MELFPLFSDELIIDILPHVILKIKGSKCQLQAAEMNNNGASKMADESKLWDLLISSSRKAVRLGIIIPIVFALTVVITGLTAVFLPDTYEGSIRVLKIGASIGFSIILVFYLIT